MLAAPRPSQLSFRDRSSSTRSPTVLALQPEARRSASAENARRFSIRPLALSLSQKHPASQHSARSYSCALLVSMMLYQGRLIVDESSNSLHFKSLVHREIHIPITATTYLRKSKLLGINSALLVKNGQDEYFFASFLSRDSCFGDIHHIINCIKVASWNLQEDKVGNDFVQSPIDDVDTIEIPRILKKLHAPENSYPRNQISADIIVGSAPLKARIRELEDKIHGSELFQRHERQSQTGKFRRASDAATVAGTLHSRSMKTATSSKELPECAENLQQSALPKFYTEASGWAYGGSRAFWVAALIFVFANMSIACVSMRTVRRLSGVMNGIEGDGGN